MLAACTPEPKPLVHGHDTCAYCKMGIADEQYGAEVVTTTGKIFTYDSIECMASHQIEGHVAAEDVHSRWVVDFQDPPNLISIDTAFFLHSKDLRSPMGLNLTAFGPGITQQAVEHSFFGDILDWQGVLDVVNANRHAEAGTQDALRPARHSSHEGH